MTEDLIRQRLVVFGGASNVLYSGLLDDTWEWDGTTWQQRASILKPSARQLHAMAYDPAHGYTLLFGGNNSSNFPDNRTWTWDGGAWSYFGPTTPSARYRSNGV